MFVSEINPESFVVTIVSLEIVFLLACFSLHPSAVGRVGFRVSFTEQQSRSPIEETPNGNHLLLHRSKKSLH